MSADDRAFLSAEIHRLTRRISELVERVEGLELLREQVEELAEQLLVELRSGRAQTEPGTMVSWVELDAEQAEAVLAELRAWMRTVLVHYSRVAEVVRPCWYRHPAAVQALLDVRAAWLMAYRDPAASGTAVRALEWSQRHLPHLERFLARELGTCTGVRHDPDPVPIPEVNEHDLRIYLSWWGGRDRSPEPPMSPTQP